MVDAVGVDCGNTGPTVVTVLCDSVEIVLCGVDVDVEGNVPIEKKLMNTPTPLLVTCRV